MLWDTIQDQQISESLEIIDRLGDDDSPVMRIMSFSDDVVGEQHLTNVLATFKRSQRFSICDVGFGRGRLLAQVGLHFPNAQLYGIDDNEESICRAHDLVTRASLTKGKFDAMSGQYDFVVCSQIFEHVADTDALLDKLFELAKPNGYISFSAPSGWTYRRPRIGNFYHAFTNWDFYRRVRLQPEKNWEMALAHHPSTQPSKVIKRFKQRGGEIVSRRSAMWLIRANGPLHRLWNLIGGVRGAAMARSTILLLDAAMNVIPGLRVFESQFVLLVRKPA